MRKAEIFLEYQNYIDYTPISPKALHQQACSSDEVTINTWRDKWMANAKKNKETFGSFSDHSAGKFYGIAKHKPVVLAGSGPSLKYNAHELVNRGDITLISCLHNFQYFEDNDIHADFYVSLDAGEVTIEEVYEGGLHDEDWYWERTKGKKLLCYIATHPKLLEKWQGDVYFFNAPVPDTEYINFLKELEEFNVNVSNGGNVLGACFYIARALMGASIIAFTGADFCFSYDNKFHAWDSKYDKTLGNVIRVKDVFGNTVNTWRSYHNFKGWFECICMTVPGIYYNCSEGGTLGAYLEGNIRTITQLPLKDFLIQMNVSDQMKESFTNPKNNERKILF